MDEFEGELKGLGEEGYETPVMKEEDPVHHLAEYLGLNEQQLDVLSVIYKLNMEGKPAGYEEVLAEYDRTYRLEDAEEVGESLRALLYHEFIVETEDDAYYVDLEVIQQTLVRRQSLFEKKIKEVDEVREDVEGFLKKNLTIPRKPYLAYLTLDELLEKLVETLQAAQKAYFVANFPPVTYPEDLPSLGESWREFVKTKRRRCLEEGMELVYLTMIGYEEPFNRALSFHQDYEAAYSEVNAIFDELERIVKTQGKVDVRYLKHPFGLDGGLPIRDQPNEFFLFIRDPLKYATGGIYIKAPHIAARVQFIYEQTVRKAKRIRGEEGVKEIRKIREKFEQKYKTLVEGGE